ncbi:MAG: hypothetical protein V1915_02815 [Candidatus Bathyarchaeota archaeon]
MLESDVEMSYKTFEEQRKSLVQRLMAEGIIHSSEVERAMKTVPRGRFLPENVRGERLH